MTNLIHSIALFVALFATSVDTFACKSHYDCSTLQRCQKPVGSISQYGVCVGIKNLQKPLYKQYRTDSVAGCYTDNDCDYDRKCSKVNKYDSKGVCI